MKKIEHLYNNFNINKFLDLVASYKDAIAGDFADLIIKCIDGYNEKNDEEELFKYYLEELLKTGEFFIKLKKHFIIKEYFISVVVEQFLWNEAYVLFCKKDKKYRLIIAHHGSHSGQDCIYILKTIDKYELENSIKEFNKFNQQYHEIDKESIARGGESKDNLNAPDFKISQPHTMPETYYNSYHKEALEMEHED